jgi:FixJ family two-component response regulator
VDSRANTVYVVDDDEAVRDSLAALLESYGLAVRDYACAEDFLRDDVSLVRACLVLDLHMPGMGGVVLLELLQRGGGMLPVIVITGRIDAALRERVLRGGAVAVLEKPVEDEALMDALQTAFARL